MIRRRSILAAFLGAPVAASVPAEALPMGSGPVGCIGESPTETPPTALQKFLQKQQSRYHRKRDARERSQQHLPYDIATKKSWSPAFKVHVFQAEIMSQPDLWAMDEAELIAFFAARGLTVGGKA